jgi:hypothetical protein
MGSSPPSTKKLDSLLPQPPKENLVSHFILGEIIDHISLIHDDFPEVDIPLLKRHLWHIRNKNVEPEGHLRGFLRVFKETKVFKDAFDELDDGMKVQLSTFIAGGGEEVVMAAGRKGNQFHLPPSPAVKHHFRALAKDIEKKAEEFFHDEGHSNGVSNTNGIATRQVAMVKEQVQKVQEKVDKVHEKVGELFHHDNHSHDINGSAINQDADDEFAVKPPGLNGHVEHAKEDFEKLLHHKKHESTTNGDATNGNAIDGLAVKPVTHGHTEKEDFEKLLHHEKHDSTTNGNATNGNAIDEFALNLVTHEHTEKDVSSTVGIPRIFENPAETKTMEVYGNKKFSKLGPNCTQHSAVDIRPKDCPRTAESSQVGQSP